MPAEVFNNYIENVWIKRRHAHIGLGVIFEDDNKVLHIKYVSVCQSRSNLIRFYKII